MDSDSLEFKSEDRLLVPIDSCFCLDLFSSAQQRILRGLFLLDYTVWGIRSIYNVQMLGD